MPEETQGEPGAGPSSQKSKKLLDPRLRLIFWLALAVFGFFLLLYVFDRNPSKGLELLTTNVLSLAVLVVICVQAYIYSRQRKHMEEQSRAMREQLDGMQETQQVLYQQLTWAGLQTRTMLNQWTTMRASEHALSRQAESFEAQVEVMNGQLEAMRRQQDQNERAIKAAEDGVAVSREGEAPYFGATKIVFRWVTTAVKNTGTGPVHRVTGQPELVITFMNGGKTPAWHFSALPHLELGEFGQVDRGRIGLNPVHGNECPDAENTFYPSGSQKCIKYRGRGEFSPTEIEAIKAGTQTLFLIVDLGYTDMRDDRKTRNWIRCLNPTTGRFGDCGAKQG